MLEINRSSELTEMKKPTADGFKCIEPQSKMTPHEAQKYWDSKFDKENNPVKYGGGSYEDVKNYSQENKQGAAAAITVAKGNQEIFQMPLLHAVFPDAA